MKKQDELPLDLATLSELTEEQALSYVESLRWPDGPVCPRCSSKNVVRVNGGRPGLLRCKACPGRKQFTVRVGTIFEDSHIPMRKWVLCFNIMCASKKGVSAKQVQRMLGVAYQTAWFMCHRVRYAMKQAPLAGMLKGTVEVDETYIGGKPRYRHQSKRGRGTKKVPVMALVQRDGNIVSKPIERVNAATLKGAIREVVDRSSTIMTDDYFSYRGIGNEFDGGHEVVKHSAKEYVRGDAYTNTAESYFALFKRGIHGAFHHVSKKHLGRYCDEFSFRWNHRKVSDGMRTEAAIRQVEGKRLTYKPLVVGL